MLIAKRIRLFLICFLLIFSVIGEANAYEYLSVTNTTRITPLEVEAGNIWNSVMQPWNKNYSKILIFEDTNGGGGKTPRGLVWGLVKDLKSVSGGTYAQYVAVTRVITGTKINNSFSPWAEWSTITGEDDILYGLDTSTHYLRKYNTATGVVTNVKSYEKTGVNVKYARIWGTTMDGNIIICLGNASTHDYESWTYGGWEINLTTGARTFWASVPALGTEERKRWPYFSHGHTHMSPDREAIAYNSSTGYLNVDGDSTTFAGVHYPVYNSCPHGTCPEWHTDPTWNYPTVWPSHVSWWGSNDWYIDYDTGMCGSPYYAPCIKDHKIWQVVYNRTTNTFTRHELLSMKGATYWLNDNNGDADVNYGSIPHGVDRKDGKAIYFFSNGGNYYTYQDYLLRGSTPWRNNGVWIADFTNLTATYSDTTDPENPADPYVNAAPVAVMTVNSITGYTVSITDASTDDAAFPTSAITVNWGDGTISTGNNRATFSHTYATAATFIITLTARDAGGLTKSMLQSVTVLQSVTPQNVSTAPVAVMTINSITGYTVSITDASTDNAAFPSNAITVNWGDGATSTGNNRATFSHTYATAGTFKIILTAMDANDLYSSVIQNVSVQQNNLITVNLSPALSSNATFILKQNGITKATGTGTTSYVFSNLNTNSYQVQIYKSGYTFDGDDGTAGDQNPVSTTIGSNRTVTFTHTP